MLKKGNRDNTRLVFLDLETSGLDKDEHEILEVAAIATDFDFKIVDKMCHKVLPTDISKASPKALEIIRYQQEVWDKEAVSLETALKRLSRTVPYGDNGIAVGHNIRKFDIPFLKKAFKSINLFWPFSYYMIDTVDLSLTYLLASKEDFPNVKLTTMSERLRLTHDTAHTAMSDVQANYELMAELSGLMKIGYDRCCELGGNGNDKGSGNDRRRKRGAATFSQHRSS